MPAQFFEWGVVTGGTSPGGTPAVPAAAPYGPAETFTGTLAAGVTNIAFTSASKRVTIRNTHDLDSMSYSFDGGATWLNMEPHQVVQEWVCVTSVDLMPVGAGLPTYEITVVLTV